MWAIFIRNILKVENNHKGKAGCWFLDSEFAKDQNMTCAKEADAKKWCDAINFLKGYYKDKPKLEWETLDNGFEIDPRVIIEIQIALEKGPFKEQVKIARDHAECLEAKKIKKYLERVGTSKLENRMATGFMKKNTGTMIEADQLDTRALGNTIVPVGNSVILPKKGGLSQRRYGILVTAKDTDYEDDDDEIIDRKVLPPWMEMETMYVFPYEDKGDTSNFELKLSTKDMTSIELQDDHCIKEGYTVRVEMKDKVYFFACETALDCKKWHELLRKSKKTIEEMQRTKLNCLKRNVDPLVHFWRNKGLKTADKAKEDIQFILLDKCDRTKATVDEIHKAYQNAQDFLEFTQDSIQCQRPFYNELFKEYLQYFHLELTHWISDAWNERTKEFNGGDILSFVDLAQKQEKMIMYYGMNDARFAESYNELIGTFCVRVFSNLMPLVLEVANKMKTDFYDEKGMLMSHGPIDLYTIINTTIDNYHQAKYEIVLRAIQGLCFKLTQNFQTEFQHLVNDDGSLEMPVLVAITNSNIKFIEQCRNFLAILKKVSGYSSEVLQGFYSYSNVVRKFGDISNSAYQRVQEELRNQIADEFINITDHKLFKIDELLELVMNKINTTMNQLMKSYSRKLWKFIFDEFTTLYVCMVIQKSNKYKPDELGVISEKVGTEVDTILEFFKDLVSSEKEFAIVQQKCIALKEVYIAQGEDIMTHIGTLRTQMTDSFNANCIKAILRLRPDIPKELKEAVFDVLNEQEAAFKSIDRQKAGKFGTKSIMLEFKVNQFIGRLRQKVRERKAFLEKSGKKTREDHFLKINPAKRFQIEEESITMKGEITFYTCKMEKSDETVKFLTKNISKIKGTKSFFYFGDDIMLWKRSADAKAIDGRIFMAGIMDINIHEQAKGVGDIQLYFKVGLDFYSFQFSNDKECKKWAKVIIYLREECYLELAPIVFEKFEAVGPGKFFFDKKKIIEWMNSSFLIKSIIVMTVLRLLVMLQGKRENQIWKIWISTLVFFLDFKVRDEKVV